MIDKLDDHFRTVVLNRIGNQSLVEFQPSIVSIVNLTNHHTSWQILDDALEITPDRLDFLI